MEDGKKFLRCLIKKDEKENLSDNAFKIIDCPVDFTSINSSLQEIYKFVRKFYEEVDDLPTFQLLEEEFHKREMFDEKDELEDIKKLQSHTDKSFQFIINETVGAINKINFHTLIQDVSNINSGELKKGKRVLKGTTDAINYLLENSEPFHYKSSGERTDSEMSKINDKALKRLEAAKENSLANFGIMSGIKEIDVCMKGVKKKELLLIAGSVGECKSTLCMNYAYNAAMKGFNVLFVTLEMSQENLEDIFLCIHANNPVIQQEWGVNVTLSFNDIKSGNLNPRQEAWYRYAVNDWTERGTNRKTFDGLPYGKLTIWQPNTVLTPSLLQAKCNYFDRIDPLHLLIVDYPGLMSPDNQQNFKGESAALNEIMKRQKQLALNFKNNEGLPVIAAFQINREGKKDVVKRTEKTDESGEECPVMGQLENPLYSSFHLSYANEAERSADYVIYTYLNKKLRDSGRLHIGGIKNRHGDPLPPFLAHTSLPTKRIWSDRTSEDGETGKVMETTL